MTVPTNPLPGHEPSDSPESPLHLNNYPAKQIDPDNLVDSNVLPDDFSELVDQRDLGPSGGVTDSSDDDTQTSEHTAASAAAYVTIPDPIRLIQIADDQGTGTAIVRLIATGETPLIPLFTYLITEATPNPFFLQIATSNRNLSRFSPQPFDTIALSQMLALIEGRGYATDAIVANVSYYDAEVNAIIDPDTDEASTPYIRPTTGTVHRLAETDEIVRYLDLPTVEGVDRRIGVLARSGDVEVPINASDRILNHHILVAGSTGSGKSHLLSNIGHAATSGGRSAILFDHKPDHQHHHLPNPNPNTQNPRAYSVNGQDPDVIPVRYWTLDAHDPNQDATMISVRARDLDPEILAGTIFYRSNEENQAEVFAHIATVFGDLQQGNPPTWTIRDLIVWIQSNTNGHISSELYGPNGGSVPANTMAAIRRKVQAPGRIPSFVDPQPPASGFTGQRRTIGNITQIFDLGLNVIRISETHRRGYALFLQNLLQAATDYRANAIQPFGEATHDLEIIIDEASDIFTSESRYLREAATGMLSEEIRKGRSRHIGFVIAVQSAGDVPENIRNNLNTTIVGRHRNMTVLRDALPTARPGMLEQADKLVPGEMFVDLFGVRSLLLAKMDYSRSQLTEAP